jgi:hypothetical protein
VSTVDNLQFIPKPIDAAGIRPGQGPNIEIAIGTIQRIAALRAYNSYGNCRDWMEKLSTAYVVALATRSADQLLMRHIQNHLNEHLSIACDRCKEASIGLSLIRERLFPTLKPLREHANALIHHLDDPNNKGIAELNIGAVFDYCYQLFHENIDALFGIIPSPDGKFEYAKCNACRQK